MRTEREERIFPGYQDIPNRRVCMLMVSPEVQSELYLSLRKFRNAGKIHAQGRLMMSGAGFDGVSAL